ncbi:MobA/MobL family protein [Luteibacter sp. E-22]|uniref:MobA/MobL family protein n=1 Tax=Luteibacter sp. E-22 TaxID=3404050 RepID=UPI003CF65BFF
MVLRHARPHLEIHTRSKGHSAVAGVAYRLGLRLWDERQQCWHDYTRRALGEEVVMALTVAPEGAPAWASDPAQLWNAVEAAERRKDSQVARDYRVPIPLGLDDHRAGQLAEKLARFIMDQLGTPVSVGLHRDADTDALGNVKPPDRQGYHAHLYFPSRPLIIEPPADDGQDGETVPAFGTRHPMLASKALGRGMVETFNRVWAELATEAAADAGLDARYDHRSYERMGVDLAPQPTLGAGATALERKGFFTRKGDAVRDIIVASKAFELAHAEAVAAQHQVAQADVARERLAGNETEPARAMGEVAPSAAVDLLHHVDDRADDDKLADLPPDASLVARFEALAPRPGPGDARWSGVMRLARAVQRALGLLKGLAGRLVEVESAARRTRAAELEARFELDEARRQRAAATDRAEAWALAHPIRMRAGRLVGRKPAAWRDLASDIRFHHRAVQATKAIVEGQRSEVKERTMAARAIEHRLSVGRRRLRAAMSSLEHAHADLLPPLLAAMTPEQRAEALPSVRTDPSGKVPAVTILEPRLTYRVPGPRPRP